MSRPFKTPNQLSNRGETFARMCREQQNAFGKKCYSLFPTLLLITQESTLRAIDRVHSTPLGASIFPCMASARYSDRRGTRRK